LKRNLQFCRCCIQDVLTPKLWRHRLSNRFSMFFHGSNLLNQKGKGNSLLS
jgi:hypothetical protein